MECSICAAERERRCCIITQRAENTERYKKAPFVNAPYVHPFRHPSYHAQQLRAMSFAKTTNHRLWWITAHDKPGAAVHAVSHEKEQVRKEKWLQMHDRFTSGIPGLFPCVLHLPIRFADAPRGNARQQGVYKNGKGWT